MGLTYPHCELPLDQVLKELGLKSKVLIENYLLVKEKHKDGSIHIHVSFKY